MKLDPIIAKFDAHFEPRKNVTFLRYKFFTYLQREDQSFNDYTTELTKLSKDCEFDTIRDTLLRDMLIIGLRNKKLQEHFLSESDLTLAKVIEKRPNCRNHQVPCQSHTAENIHSYHSRRGRDGRRFQYPNSRTQGSRKPSYPKTVVNGDRMI